MGVNGTVSLGGNLVVSFVNQFQASSNDNFTVLSSTAPLTGQFANVASGTRLTTTNNAGSFLVNYSGSTIVLSNFQSVGAQSASVADAASLTGDSSASADRESSALSATEPNANKSEVETARASAAARPISSALGANVPNDRRHVSRIASAGKIEADELLSQARGADSSSRLPGNKRLAAVNLETSNELLDLLNSTEPASGRGKVRVSAQQIARTANRKGETKGLRESASDAGKNRADRKATPGRDPASIHANDRMAADPLASASSFDASQISRSAGMTGER